MGMLHWMRGGRIPLGLIAVLLTACESITVQPERLGMSASLTGGKVRPDSITTEGTGTLTGLLTSVPEFSYSVEFSGLTGMPTGVHIHGPADSGQVAAILLDLAALPAGHTGSVQLQATGGSASGTIDLDAAISATVSGDSLNALLRAGRVYLDVHTSSHGSGELRGQVRKN